MIDKSKIENLVELLTMKSSSAETYREALKALSKESKIRVSVLNKHATAVFKGEEGELREEIAQAQELIG